MNVRKENCFETRLDIVINMKIVFVIKWILKTGLIFGFLFPISMPAQSQIQIQKNDVGYGPRSSSTFDDRYGQFYHTSYTIDKTDYYQQKKVKKILLYDSYSNALTYMVELDSTGKIIRQGIRGVRYFIVTFSDTDASKTRRNITEYYEKDELVRSDYTYIREMNFTYKDTVYTYLQTVTRSYKRGALINEQNTYYNIRQSHSTPKYLWHSKYPMKYMTKYLRNEKSKFTWKAWDINKRGELVLHKHWRKKFRNDFVADSLYLCMAKIENYVRFYILDSVKHDVFPDLKKFAPVRSQNSVSFKIPGENYIEPTHLYTPMSCGYARSQDRENKSITSYKYSENVNGLHATYFWEQKDKKNSDQNHSAIIYRFEYEYFE